MIKNIKNNNSGSTMVEVLVGFVILIIVISEIMIHVVKFSSNLVMESRDMQVAREKLKEDIYKKNAFENVDTNDSNGEITISFSLNQESKSVVKEKEKDVELVLSNAVLKKCHSDSTDYTVFNVDFQE